MKYKDFTFPSNPARIEVISGKRLSESVIPYSSYTIDEICVLPTEIKGSGVFYGEEGREACVALSRLLKDKKPGILFCPDANPVEAYMTEFSYTLDSRKGYASYSFSFKEAGASSDTRRKFEYIRAENGDNAFTIANREGVSPTDIMSLNELKTPFDIREGELVKIR